MSEEKSAILVCRGDNPLFEALQKEMSLEAEYVDMDDERATGIWPNPARQEYIQKLSEQYDVVLIDNSMREHGFENVVSVYSLTGNDWFGTVRQIADYFHGRKGNCGGCKRP